MYNLGSIASEQLQVMAFYFIICCIIIFATQPYKKLHKQTNKKQ